eukprot:TRINITY_DN780_c0_g1_i3.p1 TRINITY_DN780_c0_g1~~TRINITY_DN780_c0_g1_i3.p1  ORF type:complete len:304 (-),score=33.61 TRINITY_DN780_c0_g1_i3:168-1079(-)
MTYYWSLPVLIFVTVANVTSSENSEEETLPSSVSGTCFVQARIAGSKAPLTRNIGLAEQPSGPHVDAVRPLDGISYRAAAAEFIAMTLFVVTGCGSAMSIAKEAGSAWVLQVSLTFGLAISSLAYAIGHISGGQINCAVTFGLVLSGKLAVAQGVVNVGAQILGSLIGALLLTFVYPPEKDCTGSLGSNIISPDRSVTSALVGEVLMTFLLMFVVLETAVDDGSAATRAQACLAIGFAVFLAHSVLIPIDGCSINPTRSFGPAIVASSLRGCKGATSALWLCFVGPLVGAALAVGCYSALSIA